MKAVVYKEYGSHDGLHIVELPKPAPTADQILIRIHAVSINGSDTEGLTGKPLYARMRGLRRPRGEARVLGSDIAGVVEAVGANVTEFKPGDEVFGEIKGYHSGLAEYVCADAETFALKPRTLTFEQAAAIPQAGTIALSGIILKGDVQAGQKVLINGAGGSAGSFAIQLAKMRGAEVTGVDNTHKLDFVRSLGADHVIDYSAEDFTRSGKQYDLILDLIAYKSVFDYARALKPNGTYLFVGGSVGVAFQMLFFGRLIKATKRKSIRMLMVPQNRKNMLEITRLCQSGKVTPVIDKVYPFTEVAEAFRYVLAGHSKGKVLITLEIRPAA